MWGQKGQKRTGEVKKPWKKERTPSCSREGTLWFGVGPPPGISSSPIQNGGKKKGVRVSRRNRPRLEPQSKRIRASNLGTAHSKSQVPGRQGSFERVEGAV